MTPHKTQISYIFSPVLQYLLSIFRVVCGGIEETTSLLRERFDYIFYTGSTQVGKIIREAANKHLTPCTLELGGKSPVFIDENCNIDVATRRILWGKMVNLGQTCIAPDYILCSKKMEAKFIEKTKQVVKEWFGENPKLSPDLCRVVTDRHFDRLVKLMDSTTGKIVYGKLILKLVYYVLVKNFCSLNASIAQWQSTGLVHQESGVRTSLEAFYFLISSVS